VVINNQTNFSYFFSEKDLVTSLQSECQQLRQTNSECLNDMAVCRNKEAELLAYTQQVTEKNVQLQSEFSSMEAKVSIKARFDAKISFNLIVHNMQLRLYSELCFGRRK